jgi:hypothetical protein
MSFSYSPDKLCSYFSYQMLKLDKPLASTKYIVLWISPASTQCTYGAAVKLFCRFPSYEWLPRSSRRSRWCEWMVEVTPRMCRWCLMGKDIIVAPYIFIYFPLRFNSQPRKNLLGYPPRLRLHLGWLIVFLQTMKLWSSRCLYVIIIISEFL